jgi:hypothetical protein
MSKHISTISIITLLLSPLHTQAITKVKKPSTLVSKTIISTTTPKTTATTTKLTTSDYILRSEFDKKLSDINTALYLKLSTLSTTPSYSSP